ncbi:MAG: UvrD-helicase domain-containing protein [Stenotrophobium sp.]
MENLGDQLELDDSDPLAALATDSFSASLETFCKSLGQLGKTGSIRADVVLPALEQSGETRLLTLLVSLFKKDGDPYTLKLSKDAQKKLGSAAAWMERAHAELIEVLQHIREQRVRLATLRRSEAALTLSLAALEEFQDECRLRNRIGFTDLEWLACRLLRNPDAGAWVQFKLDQRVDHLLLDEFQDTSPTQWRLLLPLLEEMAAGDAGRARSLFIVGDIKQSIYGFRRANPELLPLAAGWMREHLAAREETLSVSRRSSPAVIDWVNALFRNGLLPDFPVHGTVREGWGRVELAPLIQPDVRGDEAAEPFRNPLTTPRPDPENTRALREGQLIAQRIRELVEARHEIDHNGERRALGHGDVLILVRKRTHLSALEQALTEENIPFTGAARGTLLQTVEARDLTALLRFLLSPVRDLDLAHALRSPAFGATDTDLMRLAEQAGMSAVTWHEALQSLTTAVIPDQSSAALIRANQLLQNWLVLARKLPVHDLLDRICNEGNLAARYESALPAAQAARVRGNLNAYIQLALEADSGRYPSLSRFLQELAAHGGDGDAPDEVPPPAQLDQVRILTVHGAKGLEAPAVFLAQTGTNDRKDSAGWIIEWPSNADRPTHFLLGARKNERDSLTQTLMEARKVRESAEEMNLLYVAVTRARQFLHISGFAPMKNSAETPWHRHAAAAFDALGIAAEEGATRIYAAGEPVAAAPSALTAAPAQIDPRLRLPIVLRLAKSERPSGAETAEHDRGAVRRGIAIHWLLEQLSAGQGDPQRGHLEARLEQAVSAEDFKAWKTEVRAVIATPALQRFFDAAQYRRAWNEVPISYDDTSGIIDRMVDDGETLWVLDYKTRHDADPAALLARYRGQLMAYREGVRRLWPGRSVRPGLLLTNTQRWIELE